VKTLLKLMGLGAVLFFGGIGAFIYKFSANEEANVREFLTKGKESSIAQIRDTMLSPGLKKLKDPNGLALFVKQLATHFGDFQGLKGGSFAQDFTAEGTVHKIDSTFRFAKAEVPLKLSLLNGQLFGYDTDAKLWAELAPLLNVIPEDKSSYEKDAEVIARLVIERKGDELYGRMSESLQKQFGTQKEFATKLATLPEAKKIEPFSIVRSSPNAEDKRQLDVVLKTQVDGAEKHVLVSWAFEGLSCYLIAFSYPYKGK